MKKQTMYALLFFATTFATVLNSCKKDDEPVDISVKTLVAGALDLNGVTSPSNVPVDAAITATFTTDVDSTTATSANITLVQDYDKANIALTITVNKAVVTITPKAKLGNGSLYKLSFGAALKASNGTVLTAIDRTFTTEGTFVPAGQIAYWNFEDNANDQLGMYNPAAADVKDITYSASRNTAAGKAATFNGTTSIIEIPKGDDLMNTSDFALVFWVKTNSADKTTGHFVMGLAGWNGFQFEIFGDYKGCKLAAQYKFADATSGSEDLWFNGEGATKDNGGWQGWTFCKDLRNSGNLDAIIKDKWAQFVCVYNSTTRVATMYLNGEKVKEQDFNLWPDGDKKQGVTGLKYAGAAGNKNLALGFIQSATDKTISDGWADPADPANNHFKGQLDDIRIFHKVLTANEITLMYNSEKP